VAGRITLAQTHNSDTLVTGVGNVKSARCIKADSRWPVKTRAFSWPAIPGITRNPCTCKNANGVIFEIKAPHLIATRLCKTQSIRRLKSQPGGLTQVGKDGSGASGRRINPQNTTLVAI
jgi:hypothetical protein